MRSPAEHIGAAGTLVAVIATLALGVFPPASASATTGNYTVTPTAGPVGTIVHLRGKLAPGCVSTGTGARKTVFVEFQKAPGAGQPDEWINVPLASNGDWAASFTIPSFDGGQAMTRGSLGSDITAGTWQFLVPQCGSAATVNFDVTTTTPVSSRFVGMAPTRDGTGYWLAQAGGGVFSYGDAAFHGSLPALHLVPRAPITGIASTPNGKGYWLVGADGGVFAFGDARYFGNARDGVTKVALLPTPDAKGYLLTTATGLGAVAAGDAQSHQASPMAVDSLLSGAAIDPDGGGYWEVGTDGGVFAFGTAAFEGSLPAQHVVPQAPIVGIAPTPDGKGYWLVGADGGVFTFGTARFYGSAGASGLRW